MARYYRWTDSEIAAVVVEYIEPARVEHDNDQVLFHGGFVNGLNAITIALAAQQTDEELEIAIN